MEQILVEGLDHLVGDNQLKVAACNHHLQNQHMIDCMQQESVEHLLQMDTVAEMVLIHSRMEWELDTFGLLTD